MTSHELRYASSALQVASLQETGVIDVKPSIFISMSSPIDRASGILICPLLDDVLRLHSVYIQAFVSSAHSQLVAHGWNMRVCRLTLIL